MVDATVLFIAVPAALVGAASFGLANAAQRWATQQVPTAGTLDPRLFWQLVHRPLWVLGVFALLAGVTLQLVALAFGPLVLVQPLLVTGLLFAATFSSWLVHRRADRTILLGCLLCIAGLTAFLLLARPQDTERGITQDSVFLQVVIALGAVVGLSLMLAARFAGTVRVLALGLATGVFFGVNAGLMKVVGVQIRTGGLFEPFGHWMLYLACVIGPTGFLLSQNTFQQGVGFASGLATIRTVDLLVGVVIGVTWLGETVATDPGVLAAEFVAGAFVVGGVALLARRSTALHAEAPRRELPDGFGHPAWQSRG